MSDTFPGLPRGKVVNNNTSGTPKPEDLGPIPEMQDFSPAASLRRERAREMDYRESRREVDRKIARVQAEPMQATTRGLSQRNLAIAHYEKLADEIVTREVARQRKTDLTSFPEMDELLGELRRSGLEVDATDVQNLVDYSILNDAADAIIAALRPEIGDTEAVKRVLYTLQETNPVIASFVPAVVTAKLEEEVETLEDPTIVRQIAGKAAEIIGVGLSPLFAAYDWTVEGIEAGNYRSASSPLAETPLSWVPKAQGFLSGDDRAAVKGQVNDDYIDSLREAKNPDGTPIYNPLAIDIVRQIVELEAKGEQYPVPALFEKYQGNLQASAILMDLAYNRAAGNTQELYRQIKSVSLSNLGTSMLGAASAREYDSERGSQTRANVADVVGFSTGLVFDPLNLAFGMGRAAQAARYSLVKLAPGVGKADDVLKTIRVGKVNVGNPVYRYFDQFTKDLNRIDALEARATAAREAGDTGRAVALRASVADARRRMSRQFDEMPETLIDDFRREMPRNADGKFDVQSMAKWIDDSNDAFLTTQGLAATQLAEIGAQDAAKRAALLRILEGTDEAAKAKAKTALDSLDLETQALAKPIMEAQSAAQDSTFFARVSATTQTPDALLPRMSVLAAWRKNSVNAIRFSQVQSKVVDKMIGKYLPRLDDPGLLADDLSDNAAALGEAVRDYRKVQVVDTAGRFFSSLPDLRLFSLTDASATKSFYRLARAFFPKRIALVMADGWRNGTPASRRKMLNGLVRSAGAVRGLRSFSDDVLDDMLAPFAPSIGDLATGTRAGERYGVTVPASRLPSERAFGGDDMVYLYHGSGRDLGEIDIVAGSSPESSLGIGFYAGSNADTSEGFARQAIAGDGVIGDPSRYKIAIPKSQLEGKFIDAYGTADVPQMQAILNGMESLFRAQTGRSSGITISTAGKTVAQVREEAVSKYAKWFDDDTDIPLTGGITEEEDLMDLGARPPQRVVPWWMRNGFNFRSQLLWFESVKDAGFVGMKGRMVDGVQQEYVFYKAPTLNKVAAWDDAAPDVTDFVGSSSSPVARSLSADRNGIQHALHMDDTADFVRAPNLDDFEALRREEGLIMQGYYYSGQGLKKATDGWSFLTLYGARFAQRNAIEEDGIFLGMRGLGRGSVELARGRQMDQAFRRASGRFYIKTEKKDGKIVPVPDKNGAPIVVRKSQLGMFANKLEWATQEMRKRGMPEWLNEFVYHSVDDNVARNAYLAKMNGDPEAFRKLVIQAQVAHNIGGKNPLSLLSDDQLRILGYFAESRHGEILYDQVVGLGQYLNSSAFPKFIMDSDSIAGVTPGITFGKIKPPSPVTIKGYGNVKPIQVDPTTGNKVLGVSAWWREIQKTLTGDGPIGEATVRLLPDPAKAKAEVARIIREDAEWGPMYRARLSRLTDEMSIEEFANSYVENVFQHFTKSDGTLNKDLLVRFMARNPETGRMEATFWRPVADSADELTARVRMSDLEEIPVNDRPAYVFGPIIEETPYIPIVDSEVAFWSFDRGYGWMGRQNARISKGPIFMANMINAWGDTKPARAALAKKLAEAGGRAKPDASDIEMAERLYAKSAMDSAYNLTLSYVDNPANRSNLAWKARNVSRYYRATEDFWRRMKRIALNRPETFWRTALTYHLLTDTGFVYKDEEGNAYFGYPGNEQLHQAIYGLLAARDLNLGLYQYTNVNPFSIGGKLAGATPSTNLNQQLPTVMGPMAISLAALYNTFPNLYKLKGLQKLTLGEYAQVSGNMTQDILNALLPASVQNAITLMDPEEFESGLAQGAMDAMAIMLAEGMLDTVTKNGKQVPGASIRTANDFRSTEEFRAMELIGMANVYTRLIFRYFGPAAPREYDNNVSEIARDLGVLGMKPLYRTLLDQNAEAPDPYAAAYSQFVAAQVQKIKDGDTTVSLQSFLPFTMSSYKDNDTTADGALASLAKVGRATQPWVRWWESDGTRDLVKNGYRNSALFLAPREGEFDPSVWPLFKNDLQLKVPKSFDEMIVDYLAVKGEQQDTVIRKSYDESIAALDPNAPDYRQQVRALEDAKSSDREANKIAFPSWGLKSGQRFQAYTAENFRAAFGDMRSMLNYMRERDGKLEGTAAGIDNAINIYLYYQQQLTGIVGRPADRRAAERQVAAEMNAELATIKGTWPESAIFIESVIDNLDYDVDRPEFGGN